MENKEIIFGRHAVLEYLRSTKSGEALHVYVAKSAHGKIIGDIVREAERKNIPITYEEKQFFSKYCPSSKHQGTLIILPKKSLKKVNLNDLLRDVKEKSGVLVLLDQLTDPHNIGSIIRSSEALGCDGVILTKSGSPGITSTIIKTSAGATAHIPIETVSNAADFIYKAKKHEFWIVGSSDHGEEDFKNISDLRPLVLVIGSEGKGIRHLTEELCDKVIRIPLQGKISSLNASVSAGILLYEILKVK